jgi:ADP-ribose pyrophosphatase YjhB (NUDIX family)
MWLFTTFGFFSIVQKPGTTSLTVRARVGADLDALREKYMPELSATISGKGVDYPYRATIEHSSFASGLAHIAEEIHYETFKNEVIQTLGEERSLVYSEVWCHLHKLEAENNKTNSLNERTPALLVRKKPAYGGVVVDCDNKVLLREPFNHHGGYIWTFPKDSPQDQERPEETALRAVQYKTGILARVIDQIPGVYAGEVTSNAYFLMSFEGPAESKPHGSKGILWATREEAEARIKMSSSVIGRARDLEVLNAAYNIINQRFQRRVKTENEIDEIEANILNCAALRFDGYRYNDATQFDSQAVLEHYLETGQLPPSPLDQLSIFFSLQRYLKWKNRKETRRSKYWQAFRSLFIQTCGYCIPPEYHYGDFYQRWGSEFLPKLNECIALIQVIHAHTLYED